MNRSPSCMRCAAGAGWLSVNGLRLPHHQRAGVRIRDLVWSGEPPCPPTCLSGLPLGSPASCLACPSLLPQLPLPPTLVPLIASLSPQALVATLATASAPICLPACLPGIWCQELQRTGCHPASLPPHLHPGLRAHQPPLDQHGMDAGSSGAA